MTGLKQMLLQEQDRLEKILSKTKKQLENAPQGTLRLSGCKKWIQYNHCMPGCGGKGEYIPKSERDKVQGLAQKSYDERIMRLAEKRLSQIRRIVRDYDEEEIEKIFWQEHRERQKLIEPVEMV